MRPRAPGSGAIQLAEAQAARLRHLGLELRRDLDTWRPHLAPVVVEEVSERIARHLQQARELEAFAYGARYLVASNGCSA